MKLPLLSKLLSLGALVAVCSSPSLGNRPEDEADLSVTIVTGEHSRDSNSVTTTLTVSGRSLVYEETYQGARANRHKPVKKKYKLTGEDRVSLIKLLKEKKLLVTKTIARPPQQKGFSRYFEISIHSRLIGKETTVSIEASRNAAELKQDRLYQASVNLLTELYRIIQRTDPDVATPELID